MNATKFRIIDQTCLNAKWIIKESNIARVGSSRVNILKVGIFFFGKLTYVLKEEDTNIIRGIPQIYNDNRNIKQQMATG
jgi:hypothetical protein